MSRKAKCHDIKILPSFFSDVRCPTYRYKKTFELRKDDRDYQVGDIVRLHEWTPEEGYTGRIYTITIRYVLRNCPKYGLMEGYCIFGW